MLTFATTEDHPLTIEPKLRRPLVYLDTCVIGRLAGTLEGERVRTLICSAGTLYVSWGHVVEICGIGDGPKFRKMSSYLKSFGRYFILVDSDTNAIAKREK